MPEYTLFDPTTGQQWTLIETWLTRELELNCILLRENEHLGIITHRDVVLFTQWCTGKILSRMKGEPDQRVTRALRLVDKWLEDEQSVTSDELEAAAGIAWAAAQDALVVDVATAQAAARTVETIMRSAWTAARAAGRAAETARSVGISYEAQAQWFVEHLQSGK